MGNSSLREDERFYCTKNNKDFSETAYDDFVTDITNQNLKDATGKIRNFCAITTPINPETFKVYISKLITEDMNVYKELEECIFERK